MAKKMFVDRLIEQIKAKNTPFIVGLDPALSKMPSWFLTQQQIHRHSTAAQCAEAIYQYNLMVLEAVADLVPAVKPQCAYYELFGAEGFRALEKTIAAARQRGLLVILDAKRGDIASTAEAYAKSYLPSQPPPPLEADALTIVPYLGTDCLEPFISEAVNWGKGIFVCVKTSNPGGAVVQDCAVGDRYLYEIVGDLVRDEAKKNLGINGYSSIGAVVGATHPDAARRLRSQLPNSFFLVPGIGAQGGSKAGIQACFNSDGLGAVINSSRAIMYPHLYGDKESNLASIRNAAQSAIAQIRDSL